MMWSLCRVGITNIAGKGESLARDSKDSGSKKTGASSVECQGSITNDFRFVSSINCLYWNSLHDNHLNSWNHGVEREEMTCYHQCHFCGFIYDHNGKCDHPFWDGYWWENLGGGRRALRINRHDIKCNHHRAPTFPEIWLKFMTSPWVLIQ